MRRLLVSILLLSTVVLFAACGSSDDKEKSTEQGLSVEITDEEKMDDEEVIALVNGSEVLGNKYNIVYPQIKMEVTYSGEDVDLDVIKERAIDVVIDQELIYQGAEKEGIVVTEEEAEQTLAEIKEANSDALNNLLEQFHLTEQQFKQQLIFERVTEQFIALKIDVDVSEEEMLAYYEEAKEQNDGLPEYDDVKAQIEASLKEQKKGEKLEAIVLKMKEEAEIEKKI